VELESLEQRTEALRQTEIPAARDELDRTQKQARAAKQRLEERNPLYDEREEKRKARLQELKQELDDLNSQIGRLRKGLGFITRYPRIVRLDRRRHETLGEINAIRAEINDLRVEWQQKLKRTSNDLQLWKAEWQELNLKIARLQDELEYLDDETLREELATKKAIRFILDQTNDPSVCAGGALRDEIQAMIRLNIQTDNYEKGLGTVAGMIALLRGIENGLSSFQTSVEAIIREQKMHSQYLKKISITLPAVVETFHSHWEPLRKKVEDDARLSKFPLEFVSLVQPALERDLSQESIGRMFDALGAELQRATAGWRG